MCTFLSLPVHKDSIADLLYTDLPATTGMSGFEWISHLQHKGVVLNDEALELLQRLRPTTGVSRRVGVLVVKNPTNTHNWCTYLHIGAQAESLALVSPKLESMCQLCDLCTPSQLRAMGFDALIGQYPDLKHPRSAGPQYLAVASRQARPHLIGQSYGPTLIANVSGVGYVYGISE